MDHTRQTEKLLSDEEVRRRHLSDPETRRAIARALEDAKGNTGDAGIKPDELPDFLREHG